MTVAVFTREVRGIDNEGSIVMARKGYDVKCTVTSALLRATHEVAAGLGAEAFAVKVPRCSGRGPVLADMLSKRKVEKVKKMWPVTEGREEGMREVPGPVRYWLEHPGEDPTLARRVLMYWRRRGVDVIM